MVTVFGVGRYFLFGNPSWTIELYNGFIRPLIGKTLTRRNVLDRVMVAAFNFRDGAFPLKTSSSGGRHPLKSALPRT